MNTEDNKLFHELIIAAGQLATVADNAGAVLSAEHEDMCKSQIEAVRAILDQCPSPVGEEWDGTLRKDDCTITVYEAAGPGDAGGSGVRLGNTAVKIVHNPTGIGRQSESKETKEENEDVAFRALEKAVAKEWASR